MKRYVVLLVFPFLLCCSQQPKSQGNQPVEKDSIAAAVAKADTITGSKNLSSIPEIKQSYADVNSRLARRLLDSASIDYNCNNERTGTITYYTENGKLVIIKHMYNEHDHFSATDIYYTRDGGLYFTYRNSTTWQFVSGEAAEGSTQDNITEQRTYIVKEKAVLCLEREYKTISTAHNNPRAADIPNKELACESIAPLLNDFKLLVAFRTKEKHDCLQN